MHQMTYYHLLLRYPGLRYYINQSHIHNRTEELWDFMIGIATGESSLRDV